MSTTAKQIRDAIAGFWTSNSRVEAVNFGFFLDTANQPKVHDAFTWTPTSVDPTREVRYGLAIGEISQPLPSGHWMIPIFIGPRNSSTLYPFLSFPLFLDQKGNIVRGTSATLIENKSSGLPFQLPAGLFFAPPQINAALVIFFFASQLAAALQKLAHDNTAAQLALGPISGMFLNQAVSAARLAVELDGNEKELSRKLEELRGAWSLYNKRIKDWTLGGDWSNKDGNATEIHDDKIRIWRPSVVVDEKLWTLQTKVDLIRPVAVDNHLIVTASGERSMDGTLRLVSITTTARLAGLPEKGFTLEPDETPRPGEVFATWADTLRGHVISLTEEERESIEKLIKHLGYKTGDKAGQALFSWVAGAEKK
ncbi:MAG TPA: hypothetical protein VK447_13760 [Myxococcaceae bacterium]|nr:hypothetical protein [Myxococcaceae bacterium]